MQPVEVARAFWERVEARDWGGARTLLAEDFESVWPHTGERFRGRDAYIGMNREFPEGWRIEPLRYVADADRVVCEIRVPHTELGVSYLAASFEIRDGLIRSAVEYWSDWRSQEPPGWRARWAEILADPP